MAKTRERVPVTGLRIVTPADFCSTLGAHSHSLAIWALLRGEREQALHQTLDELFRDLPFVDALDPDSVDDFINGAEIPLEKLHRMGFQLFAIRAAGEGIIPPVLQRAKQQMPDWNHNCYIVAPDPAYFWVEGSSSRRIVHVLTCSCRDALTSLAVQPEPTVHVYAAVKQLSAAFEGEIPWCPLCYLEGGNHA